MNLLIAAIILLASMCGAQEATSGADTSVVPDSQLVVSRITIENGDVIPPWSDESTDRYFLSRVSYGAANAIHIRTRKRVVRRELLFGVGDTLRSLDVIETERNLRSFRFLNEANISVARTDSGTADVFVRTSDNFSLAAGVILEGGGGGTQYGAIITETNFLGLGKRVAGEYVREKFQRDSADVSTTTWQLEYKDPRTFGTRWNTHVYLADITTGSNVYAQMVRPFYRLTTPYSAGWTVNWFDGYSRIYASHEDGGRIVSELLNENLVADAWYTYRWGDPALRPKFRTLVRWRDVAYSDSLRAYVGWSPRDTLRTSRRSLELMFSPSLESFTSYQKRRRLDDFMVVEDVREGWEFGVTAGVGLPSEPTDRPYGIGGAHGEWSGIAGRSGDHVFATDAAVSWSMWRDSGSGRRAWSNLVTDAWLHWYYQGLPSQTLAASVNWYSGERVDPPFQTVLGGLTGLRGYPQYRFAGTRKLLLNVEDRVFTGWRVLTAVFGFVAFADAGYVWNHDETVNPEDLYADIGIGVRVGNTRASTSRVSRLDIAYALRGQRGIYLAFGSEQVFDLFNVRPTPTR